MTPFRKFITILCAAFFIVTAPLALLAINIERRAFTPAPYQQAFEAQNLYAKLPGLLAVTLTSRLQNEAGFSLFKNLTVDDWTASLAILLPPPELKTITDGGLTSVFAYLNNETDSAAISLAPLKANLQGPAGVEAAFNILRAQPACTLEQIFQITVGALTGQDVLLCNPPAELNELIRPLLQAQVAFTASILPDEISLIPDTNSETLNDPRPRLNQLRLLLRYSLLLPILLLIALTLCLHSVQEWLNGWGWSFLSAGALAASASILAAPMLGRMLQLAIESQSPLTVPPPLVESLGAVAQAVARQILKPVMVQGLIFAALGFGMVTAGVITARQSHSK